MKRIVPARGGTKSYKFDEKIPADLQIVWNRLFQDLVHLGNKSFHRAAALASLIIFCDASQKTLGFAAYIFQSGLAGLIFSKTKVAPLVKRTLSSLELLSVFLAIKCIAKILKALL